MLAGARLELCVGLLAGTFGPASDILNLVCSSFYILFFAHDISQVLCEPLACRMQLIFKILFPRTKGFLLAVLPVALRSRTPSSRRTVLPRTVPVAGGRWSRENSHGKRTRAETNKRAPTWVSFVAGLGSARRAHFAGGTRQRAVTPPAFGNVAHLIGLSNTDGILCMPTEQSTCDVSRPLKRRIIEPLYD
ncbi:hypothetical protein GGR56DRAFT_293183 [Xylariaceae sp. FL0804]|nr:hypothetical protein GGR56DRAFT_293183 [Xylariaceae sp. FL0804]